MSLPRLSASLPLVSSLAAMTVTPPAAAQLTQPNGDVHPVEPSNPFEPANRFSLRRLFEVRGEAAAGLRWFEDASTEPAVFSPLCDFTGTLVLHGSVCRQDFGWYNVDPARTGPPANDEVYTLIPRSSFSGSFSVDVNQEGPTFTAENIRNNPSYAGGLIGFAIRREPGIFDYCKQTKYSERELGVTCTGCSPPAPWITAVVYESRLTPNAFYIGFEDGDVSSSDFNNDGDFNDQVYFVTGVSCQGGGDPCDTGTPGICSAGVTECTGACKQVIFPEAESCNGLDDDCNGAVDDGDGLCPEGQVCDRGRCVAACGEVVFTCTATQVCRSGLCVDAECAEVDCPAGEQCVGGECRTPCEDVVCPPPLTCRVGRCVDPCAGVSCGPNEVCDGGVCQTSCACAACGPGLECSAETGVCVDEGCGSVTCDLGEHCSAGSCADSCDVARCPAGERCEAGECVDACTGVTCPAGQKCELGLCIDSCSGIVCGPVEKCVPGDDDQGECVDACLGVDCGEGRTCTAGSCGSSCTGVTCPPGEVCTAGRCDNPCASLTCATGEVCRLGACVDACEGVSCPANQICEAGVCVGAAPPPETGDPANGGAGDGASGQEPLGIADGGTEPERRRRDASDDSGCACRLDAAPRGAERPLGLAALLLAAALRRRRSTRSR